MVYAKKFAAAIKVNNKILRERGEQVFLPFSSEYSIVLKNLSSVKARVKVSIDGSDVLGGETIVIDGNSTIELQRSIVNGNVHSGNAFKFIERTDSINEHRGIKIDDGLVRIEYQFEKVYTPLPNIINAPYWQHPPIYGPGYQPRFGDTIGPIYGATSSVSCNSALRGVVSSNTIQETGITVPGSISNQQFTKVLGFQVEDEVNTLILHLVGEIEGYQITKPLSVDIKNKCQTCGKVNKASYRFCGKCGTSLQIVK